MPVKQEQGGEKDPGQLVVLEQVPKDDIKEGVGDADHGGVRFTADYSDCSGLR